MGRKREKPSKFLVEYLRLCEANINTEEWKDIELGDYPLYEISNHGRIRNKKDGLIINPFHSYRKDPDGNFILERPTYLRVQLYYYENGIRKKPHFEISRLVAKYFIPIPKHYLDNGYDENSLEVNHIRGGYEIYNNFVSNLEWCTTQENITKAIETGLRHPPYGENHHSSFVNESDVINICNLIENNVGVKDAYEQSTLNKTIPYSKFKPLFYNIKYKKSWIFISQNFNF